MSDTKTVAEWFEELPEEIKNKVIKYAKNNYPDDDSLECYMERRVDSFYKSLQGAFVWSETIEGFDYWNNIANKNNNNNE